MLASRTIGSAAGLKLLVVKIMCKARCLMAIISARQTRDHCAGQGNGGHDGDGCDGQGHKRVDNDVTLLLTR
jgi:hypothetical protein